MALSLAGKSPLQFEHPTRARWCSTKLEFSPIKNVVEEDEEEPVLILKPFSSFPHIAFNRVKVGTSKTRSLVVCNPLSVAQEVKIVKCPPAEKGFLLEPQQFAIGPMQQMLLDISWTPDKSFSCRETVKFQTSTGCKNQVYLLGTAISPLKKKKKGISFGASRSKISSKSQCRSTKISEDKENVNYVKITKDTSPSLTSSDDVFVSDVKPAFFLKQNDCNQVESPARRQTYIVNSIPYERGTSETIIATGNELDTTKENQCRNYSWGKKSYLGNIKANDELSKLCNTRRETFVKLKTNCKIDDSLDSPETSPLDDSLNSEKELSSDVKDKGKTYVAESNGQDEFRTFDLATKHALFGITPGRIEFPPNVKSNLNEPTGFSSLPFNYNENKIKKQVGNFVSVPAGNIYNGTANLDDSRTENKRTCMSINTGKDEASSDVDPVGNLLIPSKPAATRPTINFVGNKKISFAGPLNIENDTISLHCNDQLNNNEIQSNLISQDHVCLATNNFHDTMSDDVSKVESCKLQRCSTGIKGSPPPLSREIFSSSALFFTDSVKKNLQPMAISDADVTTSSSSEDRRSKFDIKKPSRLSLSKKFKYRTCGTRVSKPVTIDKNTPRRQTRQTTLLGSKPVPVVTRKDNRISSPKKSRFSPSKSLNVNPKKISKEKHSFKLPSRSLQLVRMNALKTSDLEIIRHPNPYTTSNMYYDERWMEKQEQAFTRWLNFILTPSEEFTSKEIKVDAAKLWVESMKESGAVRVPTKEEISLQAYTVIKHLNELRRASCALYQSEDVVTVIRRIEKEVDLRKICIRKDRSTHADLGIKQEILELLLSYNPLWLRIGLGTIFEEIISLQSNSDVVGLSRYIIQRFLHNPHIAAKYAHPSVTNLYKQGFEEAQKSFTLKKFLCLVYFLDKAKTARIIHHNPCLFSKNANHKTSRELLIVFSREYLSGEGDITRHLRYLGYSVSHIQVPLEEFDYAVTNIATDLRCGIRLARVIELLLNNWTILPLLRMNTISRLQKIHNNNVVLKALQEANFDIDGNILAKDIVDGDREKTLSLLWQIIFKSQISKLLNRKIIEEEITHLQINFELKSRLSALNALRKPNVAADDTSEVRCVDSKLYKENEILQLLLKWCQYVCRYYGVKVHNFSSSFSDGQALCFLLHHYHPSILPYYLINQTTSKSYFETAAEENIAGKCTPMLMKDLLKNEKDNLQLVFDKLKEVGQIPILTSPADMSNTIPDEKVVITLVSYINIRLMDLSIEIRAARKIQLAWRKWHLKNQLKKLEVEISSACVIQRAVRNLLKRRQLERVQQAALTIQCQWRMYISKKKLDDLKHEKHMEFLGRKATIIQTAYRSYRARTDYLKCRCAIFLLQSYARKFIARSKYLLMKRVAVKLQQNYRARVIGKKYRAKYVEMKKCAIQLQALIRGKIVRDRIKQQQRAAVALQAAMRNWLARKRYLKLKAATIRIQRRVRETFQAKRCMLEYQTILLSVLKIQRWYRSKKHCEKLQKSARLIQACFQRYLARKKFLQLKKAAIKLQEIWRAILLGKTTRSDFLLYKKKVILAQSVGRRFIVINRLKKEKAAILIQSYFRMWLQRSRFLKMQQAALVIQTRYRNKLKTDRMRTDFCQLKKACISIQSCYRMLKARRSYARLRRAAIVIQRRYKAKRNGAEERRKFLDLKQKCVLMQALIRKNITRKRFVMLRSACITIQSSVRRHLAMKRYTKVRSSTLVIQKRFRAWKIAREERKNFVQTKEMIIITQSVVRGYLARKKLQKLISASIVIQANVRAYLKRKKYLQRRSACITLQTHLRAWRVGKETRKNYLLTRSRIITMQSVIRGWLTRRHLKLLNSSASLIQAKFKSYVTRRLYLQKKKSVTCIQATWRAYIMRTEFKKMKTAAVVLQSQVRRWQAFRNFNKLKMSAIRIQATWKAYKVRMDFKKKREAAVKLQSHVRWWQAVQRYKKLKMSTIKIQATWKAYKVRTEFKQKKKAAIVLQSNVRRWQAAKTYNNLKISAIIIQAAWKAYKVRTDFKQKKKAAIILQSNVRRWQAVRRYNNFKMSAVKIQATYKAYKVRMEFKQKKNASLVLQSHFRKYQAVKSFTNLKRSAIKIQATWKAYKARMIFKNKKNAAIVLQSNVRRWQAVKTFKNLKMSAIMIQASWKAYKVRTDFKQKKRAAIILQSNVRRWQAVRSYNNFKMSAVKIQATYKAYKVRMEFKQKKNAAIVLQSNVRRWQAAKTFKILKLSAITIQATWKAYKVRTDFKQKKKAAIVLQSNVRRWQAAKTFKNLKLSAITIQATWKAYKVRTNFKQKKEAAIVLQSNVRRWQAAKTFKNLKISAIAIQAVWKAYKVRTDFKQKKKAAIVLQSNVRRWQAVKTFKTLKISAIMIQTTWKAYKVRTDFKQKKNAAIILQSNVRRWQAVRSYNNSKMSAVKIQATYKAYKVRMDFKQKKNASIVLQSHFRKYQAVKRFTNVKKSAITIQAAWKAYKAKTVFRSKKNAAIVLQSNVRRWQAAKTFKNLKLSAITIQAAWKAYKVRTDFKQKKKAVIVLQSNVRRWQAAKTFKNLKLSAITIQSAWKAYKVRTDFRQKKKAAIVLQSNFRKCRDVKKFKKLRTSAVVLQRHISAYLAGKKQLMLYQQQKKSCLLIQSWWRSYLHMKKRAIESKAAIVLQSNFRKYRDAKKFKKLRKSVVVLQRHILAYLAGKKQLMLYQQQKKSCLLIQSWWRSYLHMKKRAIESKAATKIQSVFKGWRKFQQFKHLKQACILVQQQRRQFVKNRIVHQEFLKMKSSAVAIQSWYRSIVVQRCYQKEKFKRFGELNMRFIIQIQSWWRACRQRLAYLHCRRGIVTLQRAWRRYLLKRTKAAIIIQSYTRMILVIWKINLAHISALKIQALWRGYCHRKKIKNRAVIQARRKIKEAEASEHLRLGNRTQKAIDLLLRDTNLKNIIVALQNLVVSTRLSPNCCENLVNAGGIPILLELISSCNRSIPHMEIIKLFIHVALNIAKYDKTVDALWDTPGVLQVFINCINISREKNPEIFTKGCSVLWIFCQDPVKAEHIKQCSSITDQIISLDYLLSRKQMFEKRRLQNQASKRTFNMDSSFLHSRLNLACNARESISIEPDWILGRQWMREFRDPLTAISSVVSSLELQRKTVKNN